MMTRENQPARPAGECKDGWLVRNPARHTGCPRRRETYAPDGWECFGPPGIRPRHAPSTGGFARNEAREPSHSKTVSGQNGSAPKGQGGPGIPPKFNTNETIKFGQHHRETDRSGNAV